MVACHAHSCGLGKSEHRHFSSLRFLCPNTWKELLVLERRDGHDTQKTIPVFSTLLSQFGYQNTIKFFSSVKHLLVGLLSSLVTSDFPQRRNISPN